MGNSLTELTRHLQAKKDTLLCDGVDESGFLLSTDGAAGCRHSHVLVTLCVLFSPASQVLVPSDDVKV